MDNKRGGNPAANAGAEWWLLILRGVGLMVAFGLGMGAYFNRTKASKKTGFKGFAEAVYFTVVTTTTVGYGDCVPNTTESKWFVVILASLFSNPAMCTIDNAIGTLLSWAASKSRFYHKPRLHQIGSATFCLLLLLLILGPGVIRQLEVEHKEKKASMNKGEVWYFNVISVTTVGYGDFAFQSTGGQLFASIYLLIAPLLVVRYVNFLLGSFVKWYMGPNLAEQLYHERATVAVNRAVQVVLQLRNERGLGQGTLKKIEEAFEANVASQQQLEESLQALKRAQAIQREVLAGYNERGRFMRALNDELQGIGFGEVCKTNGCGSLIKNQMEHRCGSLFSFFCWTRSLKTCNSYFLQTCGSFVYH